MRRARELESIFGDNGAVKYKKEEYVHLNIDELLSHPEHKFKLHNELKMNKLVESIKEAGVLHAVLVSEKEGKKYLLAGYNRVHASKLLGLKDIPTIIKRDLTEIQEVQIINFTNFFPGSMDEYSLGVQVRALKSEYDTLVQNRKTDSKDYQKQRTREYFAELYEMTDSKMNRLLSLSKLNDELLECIDLKRISMSVALKMIDLSEEKQIKLYDYLCSNDKKISIKDADKIHELLIHDQEIYLDDIKPKETSAKLTVNISADIEEYIAKEDNKKEAVEKAIRFTYCDLSNWIESNHLDVDQEHLFDYILGILMKVSTNAPELL